MWTNKQPLIAALALLVSAPSMAETAVYGRQVRLVPPNGMCELGQTGGVDGKLFAEFAKVQDNTGNKLLGAFIQCEELRAWRIDPANGFDNYALVLVSHSAINERTLVSRSQLINAAKAHAEKFAPDNTKAKVEEAISSYSQDIRIGEQKALGIVGETEFALFFGNITAYEFGGTNITVAGVTGFTSLNGVPVTTNIYAPLVSDATIGTLLAASEKYTRSLVASNAEYDRPSGLWTGVLEKALVGAVVGGALAGVAGLIAGIRRWAQKRRED